MVSLLCGNCICFWSVEAIPSWNNMSRLKRIEQSIQFEKLNITRSETQMSKLTVHKSTRCMKYWNIYFSQLITGLNLRVNVVHVVLRSSRYTFLLVWWSITMDYVCEVQTRKKCISGICIRSVITIERNEYKFRYHYREKMSISSGITIEGENDYKFRYHYRERNWV